MSYPLKFLLITLLFLVPVAYMGYQSVERFNEEMEVTEQELEGLKALTALNTASRAISEARGHLAMLLNKTASSDLAVKEAQARVSASLDALKQWQSTGIGSGLSVELNRLSNQWQELAAAASKLKPDEGLQRHDALIALIHRLSLRVLERSRLIVEPELDLNYLARSAFLLIPEISEAMGRSRDMGAEYVAGNFNTENHAKLTAISSDLERYKSSLAAQLGAIFRENPALKEALGPAVGEVNKGLETFDRILNIDLLQEAGGSSKPEKMFSEGSGGIAQLNGLACSTGLHRCSSSALAIDWTASTRSAGWCSPSPSPSPCSPPTCSSASTAR